MPTYEVTAPNGKTYEVEGPEGASHDEVISAVVARFPGAAVEPTVLGRAKEAVKAGVRGGVGALGTIATGLAAALPESLETPTVGAIQKGVQALLPEAGVGYEDLYTTKIPEAFGSMFANALTFFTPGGLPTRLGLMGAQGAGEAMLRAQAEGATPEEVSAATAKGILPGMSELLPLEFMARRIGVGNTRGLLNRIARASVTGGLEGGQEAAQNIAQNFIAQGYKPDQDLLEAAGEQGEIAFGAGAIMQALIDLAVPGRRKTTPRPVSLLEEEPPKAAPLASTAAITAPEAPATTEAVTPAEAPAESAVATPVVPSEAEEAAMESLAAAPATAPVTPKARAKKAGKAPAKEAIETPAEEAEAGVVTNADLDAFELKGYGAKRVRDALKGVNINTPEGQKKFDSVFETANKNLKYNSDAVTEFRAKVPDVVESELKVAAPAAPTPTAPVVKETKAAGVEEAPAEAKEGATDVIRTATEAGDTRTGDGTEQLVSQPATGESKAAKSDGRGLVRTGKPAGRAAEGTEPTETPALDEAEKLTALQSYNETNAQIRQLASDVQKANTTKDNTEYEKALDRIVDTAEGIASTGSVSPAKRGAQRALATFPVYDVAAARERLAAREEKIQGREATVVATEIKQLQRQLADAEQQYDLLRDQKPKDSDEQTQLNRELTETKKNIDDITKRIEYVRKQSQYTPKNKRVSDIRNVLQRAFRLNSSFDNITKVVQTETSLPEDVRNSTDYRPGVKGVAHNGRIYLVADNIAPGEELAVFLHEAGAHLGFDRVMSKEDRKNLAAQVRKWATGNDTKAEVARDAMGKAGGSDDELIAYTVEGLVNKGVEPVGLKPETSWLRRVMDAFKRVLQKLGLKQDITPQELVDVAFGAAHEVLTKPIEVDATTRFSISNPAINRAYGFADAYFSGPSAPDSIVTRAFNQMKPDTYPVQRLRQAMANKNTWWEDWLSALQGNNSLDAVGQASAIDKLQASTKISSMQLSVLEMGGFKRDPKTGLWAAYKTDTSYDDILETLENMVGKYENVNTFQDAEKMFNFAAIARREKGLLDSGKLQSVGGSIRNTLKPAEMRAGLDIYNSTPEIKEALRIYDAFNARNVDQLVAAGVIDAQTAAELKGAAGYVPWFRFVEDGDNNISFKAVREYAKGLINTSNMQDLQGAAITDIQINNVLDNMAKLSNWMVGKAVGNDTAKFLADFAVTHKQAKKVGSPNAAGVDRARVVQVLDNGKEAFYEFTDPAALAAFKGHQTANSAIVRAMAAPANLLRRGIVLDPTFSLRQLPQDAIRAFVSSDLKNPYALFPRILRNFLRELGGRSETAEILAQYGIVGKGTDIMPSEAKAGIRRKLGYYDKGAKQGFQRFFDGLERVSAASDEAVRTALYELTMKETGNKVLALRKAREIINFDLQGSSEWSSFYRQTVPFMGVWMNDLNNLYKGLVLGSARMSEGQRAQTRAAIIIRGMQLAAIVSLYTMLVSDEEDYKNLDDSTRNRSLIVPGTGVRIPVPTDGIGFLFKVVPEQITRYMLTEGMESADAGSRFGRAMFNGFMSLGNFENLIPMAGSPIVRTPVELVLNRSFYTGDAIVGKSKEKLEPSAQVNENTSGLARALGEGLNLSPIKIDYFMRGLTGQLGGAVMSLSSGLYNAATGRVTPSIASLREVPLLGSLAYESSRNKAALEDFYEMRDLVDKVASTYRDMVTSGRIEEAREYMAKPEVQKALTLRKAQTRIERDLAKFRQMRKLVLNNQNLTGDEMRERLNRIDEQQSRYLEGVKLPKLREFAGVTPTFDLTLLKVFR